MMAEDGDGGSGSCSECASNTWEYEDHGGQSLQVCTSCGKCKDLVSYEAEESFGCGSGYAYPEGPTSQGKFHVPKDASEEKKRKFVKLIRDAAAKVHLSKQSVDICVLEGKQLMAENLELGHSMKKYAAGIVFMELRKTTPFTYQKFADQVNIKKTILGRIVKKLQAKRIKEKRACQVLNEEEVAVPFEARMQDILDRVSSIQLSVQKKRNIKRLACDLKELCSDSPINGSLIKDGHTSDYAYFTLALTTLEQQKEEKKILTALSKDAEIPFPTFLNRILQIRNILVKLAKKLPCLEHIAEEITSRTVQRYIMTIIHNKIFLLKGTDRFLIADSAGDGKEESPSFLSSAVNSWNGQEAPEDEGTLSDLDPEIEEYIASESEVERKEEMVRKMS